MWFLFWIILKTWLIFFLGWISYYLLKELFVYGKNRYKDYVLRKSGFINAETHEAFKKSEKQFWEDIIKGKQDV